MPIGREGETGARFEEIRGYFVSSAGSVAAARGAIPIARTVACSGRRLGYGAVTRPTTMHRPRIAACRFLLLPRLPAGKAIDRSLCCPVSTRTGVIGKSSPAGFGFFQRAPLHRSEHEYFRGFRCLGDCGDLRALVTKCRFPPGGGKAPNRFGPAEVAHYHRPSRPSDTPCTTVLPAVLSDPATGEPGPPEIVWPRSWLVGWARPWSQRPR